MGVKTTYTCDKCEVVQDTPNQFWILNVSVRDYERLSGRTDVREMSVCRSCLELLGIYRYSQESKKLPEPPTIEELIREILQRVQGD